MTEVRRRPIEKTARRHGVVLRVMEGKDTMDTLEDGEESRLRDGAPTGAAARPLLASETAMSVFRRVVRLLVLAVALSCALPSPPALSAVPADTPSDVAKALTAQAKSAIDEGRLDEALELAVRAHEVYPGPGTLWNVADLHWRLGQRHGASGDYAGALEHLSAARTWLGSAEAPDTYAAEVAERLRLIEEERASIEAARASAAAREAAERAATEPAATEPPTTDPAAAPEATAQVEQPPTTLEVVEVERENPLMGPGIVAAGAGVVLAGIGAYLLLDAGNTRDSVRDAADGSGLITSMSQRQAQALEDEADTRAAFGVAAVAVGGAAIVTGAIMIFAGDAPATRQGTSVTLSATGRDAALLVRGSF